MRKPPHCGTRRSRGVLALVALVLASMLTSVGCDSGDPSVAKSERTTVRTLISAFPASLSLLGKMDQNGEIVAVQITDSLVQYDPDLKLQPRVAESWEFSDDRLTLTFKLRQGVRWHDGRPLTADDVVFSVETVLEPLTENRTFAPLFKDLVKVEAPDPQTVVATYSTTTPDTLEAWRLPLLPRHVAGADEDLFTGRFAKHPIGCGPFRFVRAVQDQEVILEANDDYWDGRPQIDRLVFKVYSDQRTAYQALLTGDLDVAGVTANLWEEAQRSSESHRLNAFVYSTLRVWPIFWNQDGSNPFFEDPRVRRAMILALDRQPFLDNVVKGMARMASTTFHPDSVWADPELEPWGYDPDEAQRLLDEAGWIDTDGDRIRDKNGQPFRFTLMIPQAKTKLAEQLAVWQQQSWLEIGIHQDIEAIEWEAFKVKRNDGRFQAASFTLTFTPNPDMFELYHSSAREYFNFYGLADPEIDRLLVEGRSTFDVDRRRQIYHRLQRRLHEIEPISPLFYFKLPVLHDVRVQGIEPSAVDLYRTTAGPRNWRWIEAD